MSEIAAMGGEGERRTLYICLLMSLKRGGGVREALSKPTRYNKMPVLTPCIALKEGDLTFFGRNA